MTPPSPRYWSVSGYLGEVATCVFTASQMNKPYFEISLESASWHSKRAGTASMGCIRFRRLRSINRRMTGYCGADAGASRQPHQPADTDRDAASEPTKQ